MRESGQTITATWWKPWPALCVGLVWFRLGN